MVENNGCLFIVLQFLPVYNPSQEEKNDPKLYADNVQKLMAEWVAECAVVLLFYITVPGTIGNIFFLFYYNISNFVQFSSVMWLLGF